MKTAREILKEAFDKETVKHSTLQGIDFDLAMKECQFILAAMEEYANQSKWISVKDKLPEGCMWVIACRKNGYVGEMLYSGKGKFNFNEHDYTKEVTHWQYFPKRHKQ